MLGCRFFENETNELDGGGVLCVEGSSAGFSDCVFEANYATAAGGGLASLGAVATLTNCTFIGNASSDYAGGGAIYAGWGGSASLSGCTLVGNDSPDGAGISCYQDALVEVENSIIAFSARGAAATAYAQSSITLSCSNVFGNPGGDWTGPIAGQAGVAGNISADPLFCDMGHDDYHLESGSPCAPFSDPNPECDLIGAWPIGCSSMDVAEQVSSEPRLRVYPSVMIPGVTSVRIDWEIPPGGRAEGQALALFDLSGRRVCSLFAEGFAGVAHWRGLGSDGRPVPGGVYLCRLTSHLGSHTQRLHLVR